MDYITEALTRLSTCFGHSSFREGQGEVIRAVLNGRDSLVVMPTGGGKSLCYQLPATMLPGVTVVVSPLIALMKDQVDSLVSRGITATFINSTLSTTEISARLESIGRGEFKLVYVAPERFRSEPFMRRICGASVSLLAIDEAHCVSHWGHDFRPDYSKLREVAAALGGPPMIALTATATDRVRGDIIKQLGLRDPAIFVTGFDRPNLALRVLHTGGEKDKLTILKTSLAGLTGSGIIYAATRRAVEQITSRLKVAGVAVEAYHGGLPEAVRTDVQERFISGTLKAIVATNAFGMGIDRRDIRFVIHYHVPGSIEAYYQEIGRAGRDGNPATCVLLFNYADTRFQRLFIEGNHPSAEAVGQVLEILRQATDAGEELSEPDIAARLGGHQAAKVRAALNLLDRTGLIRAGDGKGRAPALISLSIPADLAIARLPDSSREASLLRYLIFEGGLADHVSVEIDEEGVASELGIPAIAVHDGLSRLVKMGLIQRQRRDALRNLQLLDDASLNRLDEELATLSERLSAEHRKLRQMVEYCYHRRCLSVFMLGYFGDRKKTSECGRCSSCNPDESTIFKDAFKPSVPASGTLAIRMPEDRGPSAAVKLERAEENGPPGRGAAQWEMKQRSSPGKGTRSPAWIAAGSDSLRPLTEDESLIVKTILVSVSRLNGRFGKGTLAAFLAGSDSLEIAKHSLNNTIGYGSLAHLSVTEINLFIKSLIKANCVGIRADGYPTLSLTTFGREVIRGQMIELAI